MTSRDSGLSIEGGDGDLESISDIGHEIGRDLGGAGLPAPDLNPRGLEAASELTARELLVLAYLLHATGYKWAHGNHVSLSDTPNKPFQESKRKTALSFASMPGLPLNEMSTYEEWARQLRKSWSDVLRDADVQDPSKARASRARMRRGEAPQVRRRLYEVLSEHERARKTPTEIGQLVMGMAEWTELGERLLTLDRERFLRSLESLRDLVSKLEGLATADGVFADIK